MTTDAHLRAELTTTTAEHCTHGVARAYCNDCRKRTDAETTTTEEHA